MFSELPWMKQRLSTIVAEIEKDIFGSKTSQHFAWTRHRRIRFLIWHNFLPRGNGFKPLLKSHTAVRQITFGVQDVERRT